MAKPFLGRVYTGNLFRMRLYDYRNTGFLTLAIVNRFTRKTMVADLTVSQAEQLATELSEWAHAKRTESLIQNIDALAEG